MRRAAVGKSNGGHGAGVDDQADLVALLVE